MYYPLVNQLPPPPIDKTGWPWTVGPQFLQDIISNDPSWPRISIITPSYNQGDFIEETIRSVLLQGYPNLEYIIIDGQSQDNSVEIIKKYESWISYWISERDYGQAAAINKGFRRASGHLLQWVNSDDLLAPGALVSIAQIYKAQPATMIGGGCENFWPDGRKSVKYNSALSRQKLIAFWRRQATYQQPSLFVQSSAVKVCGLLDESLNYCFDIDWIIRLLRNSKVVYTKTILSRFRIHPASKTCAQRELASIEYGMVSARYWNEIGFEKAKREYAAYLPHEVWLAILDRTLESKVPRSERIYHLLLGACRVPPRLLRRETWGTIRRIITSPSAIRGG